MRILLTGGAGFIGSHLVHALLQQGDEVIVFDCVPQPVLLDAVRSKITYIRGDASSEADLYRAVVNSRAQGIMHLGALMAGACEEDPLKALQVNFRSTQVLLDGALVAGISKFFYMSSISIFDPRAQEPVGEDAQRAPSNIYGLSKLASEQLACWYADNRQIDVRGIRPTWVWGPNRTNGLTALYTNGLINSFFSGQAVHVDNPEERGDWVYIHDTIKAIMLVWNESRVRQRFYTVCGGVHSLREVAHIVHGHFPDVELTFNESGKQSSPYATVFDDSPIRQDLGYKPAYSIDMAVADYISAVQDSTR